MKSITRRLKRSYFLAGILILAGTFASGCSKSSETSTSVRRAPEEEKQPSQISAVEAPHQTPTTPSDDASTTPPTSSSDTSTAAPSWVQTTPTPSDQPPIRSNLTPLPSTGLVFIGPGDIRPLDAVINRDGQLSEQTAQLLSSARDLINETLEKFSHLPQAITPENIQQIRQDYCRLLSASLQIRETMHRFIELVKHENRSLTDDDFNIYESLHPGYAQICQNLWEEFLPRIQTVDAHFSDTSCLTQ